MILGFFLWISLYVLFLDAADIDFRDGNPWWYYVILFFVWPFLLVISLIVGFIVDPISWLINKWRNRKC